MIRSMTGFGSGQASEAGLTVTAEIRSVNSRYLETSIRMPRTLGAFEGKVGEIAQARLARGKVSISISAEFGDNGSAQRVAPDLALAEAYRDAFEELKQHFGLRDTLTLNMFLRMNDIISVQQIKIDEELADRVLSGAVNAAIDELNAMRNREGESLSRDFSERLGTLARLLARVEERAPTRVAEAKVKLDERVKRLLDNDNMIDEQRLAMEVAIIADRGDITEECVRFHAHLDQFGELMEQDNPGRRLNFLLQELNREANTIGSKANDAVIAHVVVEMKEEIERLREQVQNVE